MKIILDIGKEYLEWNSSTPNSYTKYKSKCTSFCKTSILAPPCSYVIPVWIPSHSHSYIYSIPTFIPFILFHPHFHPCVQIQLHLSSSNAISISVSFQGIQFSEKIEISNSYIMFVFHDFHISAEINFCDQVDCNMLSWVKLTLCYEITLAPSFTWSKIWFCIYLNSVRLLVSL